MATRAKVAEAVEVRSGAVADFLGLTTAESAMVELRLSLMDAIKRNRAENGTTQAQAVKVAGITQPQYNRVEAGGFPREVKSGNKRGADPVGLEMMLETFAALRGRLADLIPRNSAPADAAAFLMARAVAAAGTNGKPVLGKAMTG